jgi:hypothetical protein
VVASKYDEGTVYLAQNGKRDDDFNVYLWKSTDYGETWVDISKDIPTGPVNVIREDPESQSMLYVGTDFGVYVTTNGGNNWQTLSGDLPTTYVQDLVVHPRDKIMVIATHGRGLWALDVSSLQELSKYENSGARIFEIEDAMLPSGPGRWYRNTAKNPNFCYYLSSEESVEVTIQDEAGKLITTLESSSDTGFNFTDWDLRVDNKLVKPGTYKLVVKGAHTELTKEFEVKSYSK